MKHRILILDYGAGNIASLKSALEYVGAEVEIGSCKADVEGCSDLVIPGVGSFDNAMRRLNVMQLTDAVREAVLVDKKKTLGICLGMQLFFSESEEGKVPERGLGIFQNKVSRFRRIENLSIPHVGFNQVTEECTDKSKGLRSQLLAGIEDRYFYFVHSFRVGLEEKMKGTKLLTCYGENFLSAYEEENVFLTQFHPEKSQTNGLQLLQNFLIA